MFQWQTSCCTYSTELLLFFFKLTVRRLLSVLFLLLNVWFRVYRGGARNCIMTDKCLWREWLGRVMWDLLKRSVFFSEVAPHVLSLPHLAASQGWGSESLWSCSSTPSSKPSGGSCLTTSAYVKCQFQVAHGPHRPAEFQTTYYIRAILLQLRVLTFQSSQSPGARLRKHPHVLKNFILDRKLITKRSCQIHFFSDLNSFLLLPLARFRSRI